MADKTNAVPGPSEPYLPYQSSHLAPEEDEEAPRDRLVRLRQLEDRMLAAEDAYRASVRERTQRAVLLNENNRAIDRENANVNVNANSFPPATAANPQENLRTQSVLSALPPSMRHGLDPRVIDAMANRFVTPPRFEPFDFGSLPIPEGLEFLSWEDYILQQYLRQARATPAQNGNGNTSESGHQADGNSDYTTGAPLPANPSTEVHPSTSTVPSPQDLAAVPSTIRLPSTSVIYRSTLFGGFDLEHDLLEEPESMAPEAEGSTLMSSEGTLVAEASILGSVDENIFPSREVQLERLAAERARLRGLLSRYYMELIERTAAEQRAEAASSSRLMWGETYYDGMPYSPLLSRVPPPEAQHQSTEVNTAEATGVNSAAADELTTDGMVNENLYDWELTILTGAATDFDSEAWRSHQEAQVTANNDSNNQNGRPIVATQPLTGRREGVAPRVRPELQGNQSGFTTPSGVSRSQCSSPSIFHLSP